MITIDLAPGSVTHELSLSTLTRFLNRARLAVGLRGAVDVLLTGDSTLRQLNKSFRGKNKPTDVLSFLAPTEFAKIHAGDLAISLETATRQAETYGHPVAEEIKILLLHGLLHLSGEDHETDDGEMATREATLRLQLRLPTTLIERTTQTTIKKHRTTIKKPSRTTQKSPSRPQEKSPSRPKAALFADAVERSPHFAPIATAARIKKTKRGAQ